MYHIQELRRFENDRAVFYAAEIVCALQFLHGCHVVYRCRVIRTFIFNPFGQCVNRWTSDQIVLRRHAPYWTTRRAYESFEWTF